MATDISRRDEISLSPSAVKFISENSISNLLKKTLPIGYFVTSLLSVPSSDTSRGVVVKIEKIDDYSLMLLLLELSKNPIGSVFLRRLEIEFSEMNLTAEGLKLISSLLEMSVAMVLSELTIKQYRIENDALVYLIAKALLKTNSHLTKLHIIHQKLGFKHTCCREHSLELRKVCETNTSLVHLNLSGTSAYGFACHIFQGLQHNTTLVYLNLSNTKLVATEDTAQALTAMLQVNKTLTHLDLSKNYDFSGTCVFQGLQHNSTLVYLNLRSTRNLVTRNTVLTLAKMLQVNKTLKHLPLSNKLQLFSDSEAYCVFQGLQHNSTLVYLNLRSTRNLVTRNTVLTLAKMLQVNKTLEHLPLSNKLQLFSDSGAYCVFQGLQHNTTLVYLNLSNTGLVATEDTAQALTTMLQVNKTITYLDLSVNMTFSDSGAYCVCQGLQHNTSIVYLNLCQHRNDR